MEPLNCLVLATREITARTCVRPIQQAPIQDLVWGSKGLETRREQDPKSRESRDDDAGVLCQPR
jgi:hypothetical protein